MLNCKENGKTTHGLNIARGVGLGLVTGGVGTIVGLATGGKKNKRLSLISLLSLEIESKKNRIL